MRNKNSRQRHIPESPTDFRVVSLRLEPYYLQGLEVVMDKQDKMGMKVSRTGAIRTGLSLLFQEYGIKPIDIQKRFNELQEDKETKDAIT